MLCSKGDPIIEKRQPYIRQIHVCMPQIVEQYMKLEGVDQAKEASALAQ